MLVVLTLAAFILSATIQALAVLPQDSVSSTLQLMKSNPAGFFKLNENGTYASYDGHNTIIDTAQLTESEYMAETGCIMATVDAPSPSQPDTCGKKRLDLQASSPVPNNGAIFERALKCIDFICKNTQDCEKLTIVSCDRCTFTSSSDSGSCRS